jgi:hypothetical protein
LNPTSTRTKKSTAWLYALTSTYKSGRWANHHMKQRKGIRLCRQASPDPAPETLNSKFREA